MPTASEESNATAPESRPCGCGCKKLTTGQFRRGHDLRAIRDLISRVFAGSPQALIDYVTSMAAQHGIPDPATDELQPWPRRLIDTLPTLEL